MHAKRKWRCYGANLPYDSLNICVYKDNCCVMWTEGSNEMKWNETSSQCMEIFREYCFFSLCLYCYLFASFYFFHFQQTSRFTQKSKQDLCEIMFHLSRKNNHKLIRHSETENECCFFIYFPSFLSFFLQYHSAIVVVLIAKFIDVVLVSEQK